MFNGVLTKSGLDDVDDSLAGVDVGEDLAAAGGVLGTFLEDDDLRLLNKKKENPHISQSSLSSGLLKSQALTP